MRGGRREGAGRKPLENPRKRLVMYVTDAEKESIGKLLDKLRLDDSPAALTYQLEEYKSKTLENSVVESNVEEPTPTIATAAQILDIESANHSMTRNKWNCIASILNKKLQYDDQLEPWTADTIKKAFQKVRKAHA